MNNADKYREDSMEQAQIDAAYAAGLRAGLERAWGVGEELAEPYKGLLYRKALHDYRDAIRALLAAPSTPAAETERT